MAIQKTKGIRRPKKTTTKPLKNPAHLTRFNKWFQSEGFAGSHIGTAHAAWEAGREDVLRNGAKDLLTKK